MYGFSTENWTKQGHVPRALGAAIALAFYGSKLKPVERIAYGLGAAFAGMWVGAKVDDNQYYDDEIEDDEAPPGLDDAGDVIDILSGVS